MKNFMDFVISGAPANLAKFCTEVGRFVNGDWKKRNDPRFAKDYIQIEYCGNAVEKACLFIYIKDKTDFKVGNIVPIQKNSLTHDEYNALLKKCADECLIPCATECGLTYSLSKGEVELENYMSEKSAEKLRLFSISANKSTGSAHPLDQERWNDFICETFIQKENDVLTILGRWLSEVEGWDDERANELISEYENGISLLRHYSRYYDE
jgi:hypothetical protein